MANKKESTFLNMTVTLLIVTIVASFALGGVYNLTKEKIELALKAKKEAAIKNVIPEFDRIETFMVMPDNGPDSLEFNVGFQGENVVGTAIETYTDNGFSGRFRIMVGLLPNGSICNTSVLEHKETPGLGDKMDVKKSKFPNQFMDKNPEEFSLSVKKDGGDVDAITAATISSRAFLDAVQRAYDNLRKEN